MRRILVIPLVASALFLLATLVSSSPPHDTFVGGLFDDDDRDAAVVAATWVVGFLLAVATFAPPHAAVSAIEPRPRPTLSPAPMFRVPVRAPPGATPTTTRIGLLG